MKNTKWIYALGTFIFVILFAVAYLTFSVLDITHSNSKIYKLKIVTESHEKAYDGTELTHQTWYVESGQLRVDHRIVSIMPSKITEPGSVENEIGITILDSDNEDVTKNYVIEYDLGHLTIRPLPLTIQTMDKEKSYDGTVLTHPSWSIQSGRLMDGHHIEHSMPTSITNPGSASNAIYVTILDDDNRDVSHLYDISYDYGTLSVEPIIITLQSLSDSKVYDGEPLSRDEWEMVDGTLLDGHELFVIVDGEITDVGMINNTIHAYVIDAQGKNVSSFYDFHYMTGILTVLSNSNDSSQISREPSEIQTEDVFEFLSTQSHPIYFRDKSWGDYTLVGWTQGVIHTTGISMHPLAFGGFALLASGKDIDTIQMTYLRDQVPYLLPYFSVSDLSGSNDIHVSGSTDGLIIHEHVSYPYSPLETIMVQHPTDVAQESTYRAYVRDHYLTLPESTRQAMLALATQNNLNVSSDNLVIDIQDYIRHAATYTTDFESIPDGVEDVAVYFLTVSKEGICQHYATAAVLMYRALGIPARYVTGYIGIPKDQDWVTVTGEHAHAWVEIYLDGFGWMPIEVTGGGPTIPGGDDDPEDPPTKLVAWPRDVREPYLPGLVIRPDDIILTNFEEYASRGYTYDFVLEGALSTPGRTASHISSLIIYDETGQDVTDTFDIRHRIGILQLYLYEIDLITASDQQIYDGTPLTNSDWSIAGNLAPNHHIAGISFTSAQTDVGLSQNSAFLVIHDASGEDVTGIYLINPAFGNLLVTPKVIEITSGSAIKTFDGTALTQNTYEISEGALLENHHLHIVILGTQTSVGMSPNTIESIHIFDQTTDVTKNYIIEVTEGVLVVSPNVD